MALTVIREIGAGAFGIVNLVRDETGAQFACKTFNAPKLAGIDPGDLRTRFEREVRYQSEIEHENVVEIVSSDLQSDPPSFCMHVADCSLADELAADRTLGGDPRRALFDILSGVEAIHSAGYKHRDLKPANVLKFNKTGQPSYAVSDFGLSAAEQGNASTLTASNMGGGTPLYRAPECAINFKRATALSDIYSIGAILHDIFAGGAQRLPHVELTAPGTIGGIIEKCTKQNPRRRYQSVGALRADLYAAISNTTLVFSSNEEEEVVKILAKSPELSESEWDRVFQLLDENSDKGSSSHQIYRSLLETHIRQLATESPQLFSSLALEYAIYAREGVFNFDYCDVVASTAKVFHELGEPDVKANMAIAMLVMGTNHNRWYVERVFLTMTGPHIADVEAHRLRVEIEVQSLEFEHYIGRLEASISATRQELHPHLQAILPPLQ